jgi:hypothetical protein
VGLDAADVVAAEHLLDDGSVRQWTASVGDPRRGELLNTVRSGATRVRCRLAVFRGRPLHRRAGKIVRRPWQGRLNERALAWRSSGAVRRTTSA